jgi:hypothetical protein
VTVFNTTPQGCEDLWRQSPEGYRAAIVGSWEVGHEGSAWIGELVEQGRALQVRKDGFLNRYAVQAKHLQSLNLWDWIRLHQAQDALDECVQQEGRPAQERPYSVLQVRQWHAERLQAGAPDAVWTVDIWGHALGRRQPIARSHSDRMAWREARHREPPGATPPQYAVAGAAPG